MVGVQGIEYSRVDGLGRVVRDLPVDLEQQQDLLPVRRETDPAADREPTLVGSQLVLPRQHGLQRLPGGIGGHDGTAFGRGRVLGEDRVCAVPVRLIQVHGGHVVGVAAQWHPELQGRELGDEGEGEHVADQPEHGVIAPHERRGVQPAVADQELQRQSAGHVRVIEVGELTRPHDHHGGAFAVRVLAEQLDGAVPLAVPPWTEQAGPVGRAGQVVAVEGQRVQPRRVVADHVDVFSAGEVPQGLGVVEHDVGLTAAQAGGAVTRVGESEADVPAFAGPVAPRTDHVVRPVGDLVQHLQVGLVEGAEHGWTHGRSYRW